MNTGFNQAFGYTQSGGFGNGFSGVTKPMYTPGIKNDLYAGYFADDMGWFSGRGIVSTAYPTNVIQQLQTVPNADNYSRRWTGYFRPATSEAYTFYLNSDDASYMWIGDAARVGWSTGNAVVNNGGLHGARERSGTVALTAGVSYAVQIFYGEKTGGDFLTFSYSTPSISKTTDLTDLVYYNELSLDGRGI